MGEIFPKKRKTPPLSNGHVDRLFGVEKMPTLLAFCGENRRSTRGFFVLLPNFPAPYAGVLRQHLQIFWL
jgi:hypothetical protein